MSRDAPAVSQTSSRTRGLRSQAAAGSRCLGVPPLTQSSRGSLTPTMARYPSSCPSARAHTFSSVWKLPTASQSTSTRALSLTPGRAVNGAVGPPSCSRLRLSVTCRFPCCSWFLASRVGMAPVVRRVPACVGNGPSGRRTGQPLCSAAVPSAWAGSLSCSRRSQLAPGGSVAAGQMHSEPSCNWRNAQVAGKNTEDVFGAGGLRVLVAWVPGN